MKILKSNKVNHNITNNNDIRKTKQIIRVMQIQSQWDEEITINAVSGRIQNSMGILSRENDIALPPYPYRNSRWLGCAFYT